MVAGGVHLSRKNRPPSSPFCETSSKEGRPESHLLSHPFAFPTRSCHIRGLLTHKIPQGPPFAHGQEGRPSLGSRFHRGTCLKIRK